MSSISCGLVGPPNVGKSTLFNALTKSTVLIANYPFATIDPNIGIALVPDPRLKQLAKLFHTSKIIPATISFVDIAGLVKGASQGEGLGNQFLSHIRNVAVIVEVVRTFADSKVAHVNQTIDPKRDIDIIATELALADIETLNRHLGQVEKEAKADPKLRPLLELIQKAYSLLENGQQLHAQLNPEELKQLSDLHLLSTKPVIYVFNVDEHNLVDREHQQSLAAMVEPSPALFISAKLEIELSTLEDYDAKELRESYGLHRSGLESLVIAAYKTLGLQSFLTAGEKEVRAWTIRSDCTAQEAAGEIHSDIQRGFIAADIVNFSDLITFGSWAACRSAGKVRTEGKNYRMQDGDVVEFRFNV
ncbi:redox-regulated ATPase YchF [Patescibacteria group bacterium]|nr:redox-regulated ATPase YchF [Patescibacteria group bacterium]